MDRPALKVKVTGGLGLRNTALVGVTEVSRLGIWLGEELRGRQRMRDHALPVARATGARAVITASFHWWKRSGFFSCSGMLCLMMKNLVMLSFLMAVTTPS